MFAVRCFRSISRMAPRRASGMLCLATATRSVRLLSNNQCHFSGGFDMNKHKQEAQQFYEEEVQSIVEINKKEEWNTLVLQSQVPVVLDCYADWCKPCKTLTPILESKARGAKDWRLVKLDIDKHPEIAQILKIKAVPTVYLIAGGRPIDGFSGMPDEKVLNGFFGSLERVLKLGTENEEQLKQFDEARSLMVNGKFAEAEAIFTELLSGKLIAELQPVGRLLLCECYLNTKKFTNYEDQINMFKTSYKRELEGKGEEYEMLRTLVKELEAKYTELKQAPLKDERLDQLKKAVEANPKDLETKFKLAQYYVEKELLAEGLDMLLEIIKTDKSWEGKKANNLLLQTFKKLGPSSQITNKYRKLYQRLLY